MQSQKEHIVLVRCSDGRIKVPDEFKRYLVHPISLPGGPIAPELSSVTGNGSEKALEVLTWSISTMVELKKPSRIVLVAHSYCAAAGIVGHDDNTLEHACIKYALELGRRYPHIRVTVFFDHHSECGEHRDRPPRFIDSVLPEVASTA